MNRSAGEPLTSSQRASEEGVALIFVVLAMLILSTLSVLALGAIVTQAKPTQFQRKSAQTLNAAQAGLNAAVAAIRNATYDESGTTYGDRSDLPCWSSFTAAVGDPGGAGLSYTVTIQYFKTDPSYQTASWRTSNALSCTTNTGTPETPSFAWITSAGRGPALPGQTPDAGNRTLQSVYKFSLTNPNLPGGLIQDARGLCYTGSATVGDAITLTTCRPGASTQMWAYTTKYLLVLSSTRAPDGSGGLCISGAPANAGVTSVTAVMKLCNQTDYTQKWGVNSNNPVHLFGHLTGAYNKSWCLGAVTPGTSGSNLAADSGSCGTTDKGVYPAAAVGAGASGTSTTDAAAIDGVALQWVNYQEFGRCMDITGWIVTATSHIVYPCKQDPMADTTAAASPGWNEVFTWRQNTGYFYANKASTTGVPSNPADPAYCMKSPNRDGGYVVFSTLCSSITSATKAPFTWTVLRDTHDFGTSYTIVDAYGRCLSNGPKNTAVAQAAAYSSIITAACTGSSGQKWNAPASFGSASLANTSEVLTR
jgi:Tfp pilus assembly protein PilX